MTTITKTMEGKSKKQFQHAVRAAFPGGSDSKESACNPGSLVWSPGQEDPLEKGLATCSSVLAWIIPWTEESSRLQSTGSQRLEHDWATNTFTLFFPPTATKYLLKII